MFRIIWPKWFFLFFWLSQLKCDLICFIGPSWINATTRSVGFEVQRNVYWYTLVLDRCSCNGWLYIPFQWPFSSSSCFSQSWVSSSLTCSSIKSNFLVFSDWTHLFTVGLNGCSIWETTGTSIWWDGDWETCKQNRRMYWAVNSMFCLCYFTLHTTHLN